MKFYNSTISPLWVGWFSGEWWIFEDVEKTNIPKCCEIPNSKTTNYKNIVSFGNNENKKYKNHP